MAARHSEVTCYEIHAIYHKHKKRMVHCTRHTRHGWYDISTTVQVCSTTARAVRFRRPIGDIAALRGPVADRFLPGLFCGSHAMAERIGTVAHPLFEKLQNCDNSTAKHAQWLVRALDPKVVTYTFWAKGEQVSATKFQCLGI